MAGRHHALLIGIDAYDGGGMLTGCVNDIDLVQRLLIDRVGVVPEQIRRLAAPRTGSLHESDVPAQLPTLDNIRAALQRLGGDEVAADDRVFIYYSGHGTQCLVADGAGRRFSREALLPKDKKVGAQYRLLFDWELNALIAKISARTPAVTVVLDCCCSAGATRDIQQEPSSSDRYWRVADVQQLESGASLPGDRVRGLASGLSSIQPCQVVAACRDDQRARESVGDGTRANGELTRALMSHLMAVPAHELSELRWGQLWRAVEAAVRAANPRQSPWLSGSFGRRIFGFGADEETDPGFAIRAQAAGFRLDVGTLAGVTPGAQVGVYGPRPAIFPPLDSPEDRAARSGLLRVTEADRATCVAVPIEPFELPDAARGRMVKPGAPSRLTIALSERDDVLTAGLAASPLVQLRDVSDAELTLSRVKSGGWALVDDVHGSGMTADEPVLCVVPGGQPDLARRVVEHYHDYVMPLRMARSCRDLPGLLRLWLLDCTGASLSPDEAQNPDLPQLPAGEHAPYEMKEGAPVAIVVENGSETSLYVALFDCAASGRVLLLGEKPLAKRSKHVFWLDEQLGEPFIASLPDDRTLGVDRLVAIATTRPDASLKFLERSQSFANILAPARATRSAGSGEPAASEPAEAWTAAVTALRISR